jgi:SAM-dependent methyltransferase
LTSESAVTPPPETGPDGSDRAVPAKPKIAARPAGAEASRSDPHGGLLPRSGPFRTVLKRLYYSWAFRTIAYAPVDAFQWLRGRRDPLVPPRRLQYVGHGGDFERVGAGWRELLVRHHGLTPTDDVLDIGCGIGRIAVALTPYLREGSYEGFDIVPQGIAWCSKQITPRFPSFRFQLADVHNRQYNPSGKVTAEEFTFPYPDDSFDVAVASSVFTHMWPDGIRRYIEETARVLRPGGRLVCDFFLVDEPALKLMAAGRSDFALDHEFTDGSGTTFLGSHPRVPEFNVGLRESTLVEICEASGLRIERPIRYGGWSGRAKTRKGGSHDQVTLTKPAS